MELAIVVIQQTNAAVEFGELGLSGVDGGGCTWRLPGGGTGRLPRAAAGGREIRIARAAGREKERDEARQCYAGTSHTQPSIGDDRAVDVRWGDTRCGWLHVKGSP